MYRKSAAVGAGAMLLKQMGEDKKSAPDSTKERA